MTREITMMFFPADFCWHKRQTSACFEEMRAHGVRSVCLPFTESDRHFTSLTWYADLAHAAGLAVYAMPGRVAGLFAAGHRPCSRFVQDHPEALAVNEAGHPHVAESGFCACVNQPAFADWFYSLMERAVGASGAEGMLFDEPKAAHLPCWCGVCRSKAGDDHAALVALRERSMARMMGCAGTAVKSGNLSRRMLVMCMPGATRSFIDALAGEGSLDAIGVDGPVCAQTVEKESLFDSSRRMFPGIRSAGKEAFALVETFNVPASSHGELETNLERLETVGADVWSFNYYPHAVECPDAVMEKVWKAVGRLSGK